jgi:hypothetical protein
MRGKAIQSGAVPGLFDGDGKKLKAEVREMIDAAIAQRTKDGQPPEAQGDRAMDS